MYRFEVFYHEIKKMSKILEENLKKISVSNDPETVHKCRVNIRRIRGVLKLFKCPKELETLIKEISSMLGPLRDIECQIDFLINRADMDNSNGDLLDDLLYRREVLKRQLIKSIPEFSRKEFLFRVKNVLKNKVIYEYRIYLDLYKRVHEIIINHTLKDITLKELHELRIKLKKIRYILEALSVENKDYKRSISFFKKYQDCLGEIHDIDIWLDILSEKMSEFGNLRSLLRKRRHKKITEFRDGVHEIPSALGKVLSVAATDIEAEFGRNQDIRSMGYSWDQKLSMAEKLAIKLSPDPQHIKRIREKSIKIFNEAREVMDLDEKDIFLLEAGAILHDIGYSISEKKYNYHSYEIINTSEYLPFSLEERILISMTAKNHRGKFGIGDGLEGILPSKEIRRIIKLSGILRAADGMEFESFEYVKDFEIKLYNGELVFELGDISEVLAKRFSKKVTLLKGILKKDFKKVKRW